MTSFEWNDGCRLWDGLKISLRANARMRKMKVYQRVKKDDINTIDSFVRIFHDRPWRLRRMGSWEFCSCFTLDHLQAEGSITARQSLALLSMSSISMEKALSSPSAQLKKRAVSWNLTCCVK